MKSVVGIFVRMMSLSGIVVLFSSYHTITRQVNVFSVEKAGIRIGTMTAISSQEGNVIVYTLTSNTSFWLGTRVWVNHNLRCTYDRSKIIRADMNTKSSKGNFVSWIAWKGDHYDYDVKSYKYNRSGKLNSPIDFSLVKMYFHEPPVTRKNALAENHAEMVKIACTSQHVFIADVNEKPNVYYYTGGRLMKAELSSSSVEYTIQRVE